MAKKKEDTPKVEQTKPVSKTAISVKIDPENNSTVILSRWPTEDEKEELAERIKKMRAKAN